MGSSPIHDKIVEEIAEMMREELDEDCKRIPCAKTNYGYGAVPDIEYETPFGNIVVEVGQTRAEKMANYLADEDIAEVRWYTKTKRLIGLWRKSDPEAWLKITYANPDDQVRQLREASMRYRSKAQMCIEKEFGANTYITCPGCFKRVKLIDAHVEPWDRGGNKTILKCQTCDTIYPATVLDGLPRMLARS